MQELQQFRSEFFGRLRDVLKGRDDVQIVGDEKEVIIGNMKVLPK